MDTYRAENLQEELNRLREMTLTFDDDKVGFILFKLIRIVKDIIAYLPKENIKEIENEGFYDEVGGYHDCGIGWSPKGTWCGECLKSSCKRCPNTEKEGEIV